MSVFRRYQRTGKRLPDDVQIQEIDERHWLALEVFSRRSREGWSQEELASRADMTQPQIASVEAGEANPTLRTLVKLSNGLGCAVHDLFRPRTGATGYSLNRRESPFDVAALTSSTLNFVGSLAELDSMAAYSHFEPYLGWRPDPTSVQVALDELTQSPERVAADVEPTAA